MSRSPCSVSASTMTRRARQPELVEPAEQPVGEALRRERGFVDVVRGRIELDRLDQLGWECGGNRLRAATRRGRAGARCTPGTRTGRAPKARGARRTRPSVRSPSRASRSTSSGPPATCGASTPTDHGARNDGGLPAGHDEHVGRACREPAAASPPSAIPTRTSHHSRVAHDLEHRPRAARRHHRSTRDGAARRERATPRPIEHDLRHELFDRAHHGFESSRASAASSASTTASSAHRASASRRRRPRVPLLRDALRPTRCTTGPRSRESSGRPLGPTTATGASCNSGARAASRDDRPVGAPQAADDRARASDGTQPARGPRGRAAAPRPSTCTCSERLREEAGVVEPDPHAALGARA